MLYSNKVKPETLHRRHLSTVRSQRRLLLLVTQSHPALCPMHCGLPGSSVHGILQAGTLERGARLLYPLDSSGSNAGMGCQALLQGILPTQGSNSHRIGRRIFTVGAAREALAVPYHLSVSNFSQARSGR